MKSARVVVLPYDEGWKKDFEEIKAPIERALSDLIIDIQHVGSTSVEGLCAKPCIDIDVVIKDYSVFDDVVLRLGVLGYIHEGDLGIKDREAFKYSDKPHLRSHHLYVCPAYSRELGRHIAFRDFLRANPAFRDMYGEVKSEGARLYPDDIDKYISHKSECIKRIYELLGIT